MVVQQAQKLAPTAVNGATAYTGVAKVQIGKTSQEITVYPNPIINGTINLQLNNQPAGEYGISLHNSSGQLMMEKQIQHTLGSSTEIIQIDNYIPLGV